MEYTLNQLLALDNLDGFSPEKINEILEHIFESGREQSRELNYRMHHSGIPEYLPVS